MITHSNEEYADFHYIYGYCDDNERTAVEEYQRRFPDCNDDLEENILEMTERIPSSGFRRMSDRFGVSQMQV
jgi:hypothetical protein